ncbi:MAG TPA: hypothetical protein VK177_11800 [Flavobacteriales bacterium]|nr:hypothetical protein [Flavobacteriales bacterium]
MRNYFLSFIILFFCQRSFAQINAIDTKKIPGIKTVQADVDFVLTNVPYYQSWAGSEWKHEVSKEAISLHLKESYTKIKALPKHNIETELLLGQICHYFHNLDYENHVEDGITHFKKAIAMSKKDYRGYWLLGDLLASATMTRDGMNNMLTAEKLLPAKPHAEFWNSYAYYAYLAMMPRHSAKGFSEYRKITGKAASSEEFMLPLINSQLPLPSADSTYDARRTWSFSLDTLATFTNTMMGFSIKVDTAFQINPMPAKEGRCALTLGEPRKNNGKPGYSIFFLATAVDKGPIEEYLKKYMQGNDAAKDVQFKTLKSKHIAKEVTNKDYYPDQGGAHLYFIAFDRDEPMEPGMIFEKPYEMPRGEGIRFVNPVTGFKRYPGKIRYIIMLDACETIHNESLEGLNEFIRNLKVE